jgi:OFA family oxalate/formate antiporter-like MFS transporter
VVGFQIGTYLLRQKGWSPKYIVLTGGSIAISGIFASSFAKDLPTFIALYGILSGIGTGMTYMVPLVCCMEYFPDNKGLISGIIMGSYGGGSFIFNLLATKIVNPNGDNADIKTNDPNLNIFEPSVANRVPMML